MPIRKNGAVQPPQVPAGDPQPPASPVPTETKTPLGPYDSLKDRRISRAGLYQAALQSQGVMVHNSRDFASYLAGVRQAAEEGLKFINE